MVTALVACGPNSVYQPCLFFESMEQGRVYLEENIPGCEITEREEFGVRGLYIRIPYAIEKVMAGYEPGDGVPDITPKFWTSYYGGCGGAGAFFLGQFPLATPFLNWDLD